MLDNSNRQDMVVYEKDGDVLYIRLPVEFDHFASRNMKVETEALVTAAEIRNVVFDFTRTEFMDSTGIGILMGRYKYMKYIGGNVYVWHVGPHIRKMLDVSGISKLITELEG